MVSVRYACICDGFNKVIQFSNFRPPRFFIRVILVYVSSLGISVEVEINSAFSYMFRKHAKYK